MISAEVGSTDNVTGSKRAIASAGPIPGSTPTKVPKNVPSNPYIKFCAERALPNPSSRRFKFSIYLGTSLASPKRFSKNPSGKKILNPFENTK